MNLIDQALAKFPKARKIAVENVTMGVTRWDMAAEMNLEMDKNLYKWNADTMKAIRFVIDKQVK